MLEQITIPQWVSLSNETRHKFRQIFGIPKTGAAQVETDNMGKARILSDGCSHKDLESITVEKLINFLGSAPSDENIHGLFKMAVEKVEKEEAPVHSGVSNVVAAPNALKCGENECMFETASKFAMRMHKSKKHPNA